MVKLYFLSHWREKHRSTGVPKWYLVAMVLSVGDEDASAAFAKKYGEQIYDPEFFGIQNYDEQATDFVIRKRKELGRGTGRNVVYTINGLVPYKKGARGII